VRQLEGSGSRSPFRRITKKLGSSALALAPQASCRPRRATQGAADTWSRRAGSILWRRGVCEITRDWRMRAGWTCEDADERTTTDGAGVAGSDGDRYLAAFVLLYYVSVRTMRGRLVSDASLRGAISSGASFQDTVAGILDVVSVGSLLGAIAVVAVIALVRLN